MSDLENEQPERLDSRARALERSLESARLRRADQFDRLIEAARALLMESGSDFTVHDVVERSQISLRAFYQYFEGKDDLILTLYEQRVRSMLRLQQDALDGISDPVERVTIFCRTLTTGIPPAQMNVARALAIFYHRLSEIRPDHLAMVHAEEFAYLVELVKDCRRADRVAIDVPDEQIAHLILQGIFAYLQGSVLSVNYGGVVVDSESYLAFATSCFRPA